MKKFYRILTFLAAIGGLLTISSCSTTGVEPLPPMPEVPEYAGVPHPTAMNVSDVRILLQTNDVPAYALPDKCYEEVKKIQDLTNSQDEIKRGVSELVTEDPIKYHWCYYSTLIKLEDYLKDDQHMLEERQKMVTDTYAILVQIATAFDREYKDPRYLQMAAVHYRSLSEWVFYRPLELTPEGQEKYFSGRTATPFGLEAKENEKPTVLQKYGLRKPAAIPTADPLPATSVTEGKGAKVKVIKRKTAEARPKKAPAPSKTEADDFDL